LGLARTLKGRRTQATTEKVRQAYRLLTEEYRLTEVSRVTFWRTVKTLEREGVIQVDAPESRGEGNRLSMDEVPASLLTTLLEARLGERKGKA
jgi:Cdc6-like AAA superfamily ATPase